MDQSFFRPVKADFNQLNAMVIKNLDSRVPLVKEIADYLVDSGGKRLRPLLTLLTAKLFGYQGDEHIKLATVIEFLHTAMLLHDDVVDESDLRRGKKTANVKWGNAPSVLVGDFLHSRAFELMVEVGSMEVMAILSRATNIISEGEVQQLCHIKNPKTTENQYMEIITRKTATLFQAAAQSGAVIAGANKDEITAIGDYALHLGIAFQLMDDNLDYVGYSETLGKNVGDDFSEGKVTLPIIAAIRNASSEQANLIKEAVLKGGVEDLDIVVKLVREAGGLDYTEKVAAKEKRKALSCVNALPKSPYKDALEDLAEFSIKRTN
ncbi:MAG: polyprenyl synthetase family protein [Pseudomonadota bacterium]|nr:polyprenyl synthetase family protein [Pseudomonadota bacterium]